MAEEKGGARGWSSLPAGGVDEDADEPDCLDNGASVVEFRDAAGTLGTFFLRRASEPMGPKRPPASSSLSSSSSSSSFDTAVG